MIWGVLFLGFFFPFFIFTHTKLSKCYSFSYIGGISLPRLSKMINATILAG